MLICPRCNGRDSYYSKRPVIIGNAWGQYTEYETYVACRRCGEEMHDTDAAQKEAMQWVYASIFFVIAVVVMIAVFF